MKPTTDDVKRQLKKQDDDFDDGTFVGGENESEEPEDIDKLAKQTLGPDAVDDFGSARFYLETELDKDTKSQSTDEGNEHPIKQKVREE